MRLHAAITQAEGTKDKVSLNGIVYIIGSDGKLYHDNTTNPVLFDSDAACSDKW